MVVNQAAGIGFILLGALVCLLGYRLVRVVLGVVGFAAGVLGATWLGGDVLHIGRTWLLVLSLVGGIVGAVLAAVLFKVGLFILGAAGGALAAVLLVPALTGGAKPLVVAGIGVGAGILTLLLRRPLVSIATAFIGAWGVTAGAFHLAGWYELPVTLDRTGAFAGMGQRGLIMLGVWVVLGIIGTVVQLSSGKRKKQE